MRVSCYSRSATRGGVNLHLAYAALVGSECVVRPYVSVGEEFKP